LTPLPERTGGPHSRRFSSRGNPWFPREPPPSCPGTASHAGAHAGQSPAPPANGRSTLERLGALAQLGERRLCKPEVAGSIPARSTVRLQGECVILSLEPHAFPHAS